MLTKMLSSESQLIQKVSPKLQAVKFFKRAITFLVFVCVFSVSAFAYTESQDGVDTIYTFPFVDFYSYPDGGLFNYISNTTGTGDLQSAFRFNGKQANYNGGVDYNSLTRYRYTNVRDSADTSAFIMYGSVPSGSYVGGFSSAPFGRAQMFFSLCTDLNSKNLSIEGDFEIKMECYVPYFQISDSVVHVRNAFGLRILTDSSASDYTEITPTIVNSEVVYSSSSGGSDYQMCKYELVFVVDNNDYSSMNFNAFALFGNFTGDFANPQGDKVYFSMYSLGIGDVIVRQLADNEVREYYQAISAGNNDLKQYFGTVNQVDQNRIDSSNSNFSDFNNKVNDLGEAESELNTTIPEGAFDTPDIVTENLGVLDDYWSIFFGSDSDITPTGLNAFLRDTVVAVTVISMLSLVMFGIGGVISKIRGD